MRFGGDVLLKSYTEEVVSVINRKKFISLFMREKVEVLACEPGCLHPSLRFGTADNNMPSVIRLKPGVPNSQRLLPATKHNVMLRDRFTCQYTGDRLRRADCTIDHVIPRSRWDEVRESMADYDEFLWPEIKNALLTSESSFCWENLVVANRDVNADKADELPWEYGVELRAVPKPVTARELALLYLRPSWRPHLGMENENE